MKPYPLLIKLIGYCFQCTIQLKLGYLKSFPKYKDDKSTGCSATLVWSGEADNNVAIPCFQNKKIGFVLDPNLIDIPQADFVAQNSFSLLTEEVIKKDAFIEDIYRKKQKLTTKYPPKKGYFRTNVKSDDDLFVYQKWCTNAARNEHTEEGKSIYHEKGSASVFAKNVWRKYFKRNFKSLNEAIVYSETNPIIGLIITSTPSPKEANELLKIISNNPSHRLYFYNMHADEHIVRYLENNSAKCYLNSRLDFNAAFDNAAPFKGIINLKKLN